MGTWGPSPSRLFGLEYKYDAESEGRKSVATLQMSAQNARLTF